jgi:uncharacterized protein (DUF736 family)
MKRKKTLPFYQRSPSQPSRLLLLYPKEGVHLGSIVTLTLHKAILACPVDQGRNGFDLEFRVEAVRMIGISLVGAAWNGAFDQDSNLLLVQGSIDVGISCTRQGTRSEKAVEASSGRFQSNFAQFTHLNGSLGTISRTSPHWRSQK